MYATKSSFYLATNFVCTLFFFTLHAVYIYNKLYVTVHIYSIYNRNLMPAT